MYTFSSLFLIGPMGAGKSTVGRYLAHALQWDFYDSDKEIEKNTGVNVAWIFDVEGEAGFRKREEMIIDELSQRKNIVLATGGGAILSPNTQKQLKQRGTIIYLQISMTEQQQRVLRNQNRPLLQTPDISQTLVRLQAQREPLYQQLADWTFCTDQKTADRIAEDILACIKST